jgi:hypothetical protein
LDKQGCANLRNEANAAPDISPQDFLPPRIMKKLLTFCFVSTLALAARADTFTFTPSDADIGDLDHHYAYTWGINLNLPSDSKIVGATLTIQNIWDWRVENDKLFIRLLDDPSAGIKTFLDNTNDNVLADYFLGQGTSLTTWTDPKGGYDRGFDFTYNFTASQLDALTSYITNGHTAGNADFGIAFDPDCHYYNDGISLSVQTSKVPDGGMSVVLLGLGLLAISGIRRILPA